MDAVKKIGGYSMVGTNAGTYAIGFNVDTAEQSLIYSLSNFGNWESDPVDIAGTRVVPWGADNNLPSYIRTLLEKNNLGPANIERKIGLQYGQGPFLYRLKFEENEIVREWVEDQEIQKWLDSWDYRGYVRDSLLEFNYMRGVFVKYFSGRARRLGKAWISRLETMHSAECRLEWPENGRKLNDCNRVIVGDFELLRNRPFLRYPLFDPSSPTDHATSIYLHCYRTFGRYFYPLPTFTGAIPWIKRANDLPEIIAYLTENMIAAAYHVHEPAQYWIDKANKLRELNPEWDETRIDNKIDELRDEVTQTIAKVLAGKRNSGKFFESIDFVDPDGNACAWKIEPIEMNIDKFIEAQSKISRIAESATTSSFGLNPALSNIIIDGKSDSGSQMLYAAKLFYASETQIAEDIIFEAMNWALNINFPGKKLSMGLYRQMINKENNVTASQRASNNI